jgi:hypothetical protein
MIYRATFISGRRTVTARSTLDLSLFFKGYLLPRATLG